MKNKLWKGKEEKVKSKGGRKGKESKRKKGKIKKEKIGEMKKRNERYKNNMNW